MEKANADDKFNIMMIGDEDVGKTSILDRYQNDRFFDQKRKTLCNLISV